MNKSKFSELGWKYIGNGLWQCEHCGHLMANRELLALPTTKCPKCTKNKQEESKND